MAALRGVKSTAPTNAMAKDAQDTLNREVFEESLHIIKKAWASDVFSHKGKHWEFPPNGGSAGHPAYREFGKGMDEDGIVRQIGIAPKCFQNPHPKIYGGFAASLSTIDFWAREGGKPIVLADNLDFCEKVWHRYAEAAIAADLNVPQEDHCAWGGFLMLTDDKGKAQALMDEHKWFWDKWFIPFGQKMPNVLIGSAEEIVDTIGKAHDRLKFNELFLMFGQGHLDPEQNNDELEKFARLVAPHFSTKDKDGTMV